MFVQSGTSQMDCAGVCQSKMHKMFVQSGAGQMDCAGVGVIPRLKGGFGHLQPPSSLPRKPTELLGADC